MKKFILALAAVACLALVKTAPVAAEQGFYAGAFAGANFLQTNKRHHVDVDFDTGYAVGLIGGYSWCNGLRAEGEITYRYNKLKSVKFFDERFHVKGHLHSWSYMVNGFYDFQIGSCWNIVPYIGAGIGYSNQELKLGHRGSSSSSDETRRHHGKKNGFAWQVLAGLTYVIDCHWDASLEYIFHRGRANNIYDHSLGLAGRYHF